MIAVRAVLSWKIWDTDALVRMRAFSFGVAFSLLCVVVLFSLLPVVYVWPFPNMKTILNAEQLFLWMCVSQRVVVSLQVCKPASNGVQEPQAASVILPFVHQCFLCAIPHGPMPPPVATLAEHTVL